MTISEIQKNLKTSFKNGFYIRRPHFGHMQIYINKDGQTWECRLSGITKIELMKHEYDVSDWEIV